MLDTSPLILIQTKNNINIHIEQDNNSSLRLHLKFDTVQMHFSSTCVRICTVILKLILRQRPFQIFLILYYKIY